MTGIDTGIASALASRIDTMLQGVGAGGSTGTAQTGAPALTVGTPATPAGAAPLPNGPPPASAQAVLSEVALTLDAISRSGGEATPAVLGEAPIWPAPPAIVTPAAGNGALFTQQSAAAAGNAASAAGGAANGAAGSAGSSGAAPLAATSTATTAATLPVDALAAALEQTVTETGLFYESHLAQWLSGIYPPNALANEPQTRLAAQAVQLPLDWSDADAADAGVSAWSGASALGAGAGLLPRALDPRLLASAFAQLRPGASAYANAGAGQASARSAADSVAGNAGFSALARAGGGQADNTPSSIAASIHPATIPLVRQQLDLLATNQFRWSGEVWPGAKLDWTIEPEPERRRGAQPGEADPADDERAWRTRVTLALPTLGTVDADLVLKGTQLIVRVQASPSGAARLATGGEAFGRRLEAAGIELTGLSIREIGGAAPAAGGAAQTATSAYARAAAEAADAEAHDMPETDASAAAAPMADTSAAASGGKRTGAASPIDHLFDDPFDWSGL